MAIVLTQRQRDVLNHVVLDADEWAGKPHIIEDHVLGKVAVHEGKYDSAVAAGNYKNRAQRDTDAAQAIIARNAAQPYGIKRQVVYPPMADQLDAIWKGGEAQADMKVMIDKVKSDIPKE